jgi:hypothetical protein
MVSDVSSQPLYGALMKSAHLCNGCGALQEECNAQLCFSARGSNHSAWYGCSGVVLYIAQESVQLCFWLSYCFTL